MKNLLVILIILCIVTSCSTTKKITDQASLKSPQTELRDGSSFAKAIIIEKQTEKEGIDAEYEWIRQNYPGYKFNGQALSNKNNVPYDILDIITSDGQSKKLYFNISKFFGKF
jgi:hypothetical protein